MSKIYKKNEENKKLSRFQGKNFRWVVPQLPAEIWGKKEQFKAGLLDRLKLSKTAKKGIKYYSIAIESHADGSPHLDMLIILEKRTDLYLNQLDFLCQKHGNLTRYRTLNQAILQYGSKEDTPLTNLENVQYVLNEQEIKKCPVTFLMKQVDKDPYHFDFITYCGQNQYFTTIQRWSYVKNKIRDYQEFVTNQRLTSKPGIKFITPELIQSTLTTSQQLLYHSHPFYQTIVDYLNQINLHGWSRPTHSKQLYIRGRSRIGKTSLIEAIQSSTSVYPVGTINWFPQFRNQTYKLMFWDQAKLDMMSFNQLLMLMDGRPFHLPFKGGSTPKRDNQLWILCSNQSLESQMESMGKNTQKDFLTGFYKDQQINAAVNRIQELIIPDGYNLFILHKLIIS